MKFFAPSLWHLISVMLESTSLPGCRASRLFGQHQITLLECQRHVCKVKTTDEFI